MPVWAALHEVGTVPTPVAQTAATARPVAQPEAQPVAQPGR